MLSVLLGLLSGEAVGDAVGDEAIPATQWAMPKRRGDRTADPLSAVSDGLAVRAANM